MDSGSQSATSFSASTGTNVCGGIKLEMVGQDGVPVEVDATSFSGKEQAFPWQGTSSFQSIADHPSMCFAPIPAEDEGHSLLVFVRGWWHTLPSQREVSWLVVVEKHLLTLIVNPKCPKWRQN